MAYRWGPIFWGVVLVGIGALFLAEQFSGGAFDVGEFFGRWWPLLLVLLGAWFVFPALVEGRASGSRPAGWAAWGRPGSPDQQLSMDIEGASSADIAIAFGAGELTVSRGPAGKLLEGTFEGGVRPEARGPGRVRLSSDPGWSWGPGWWRRDWRVGLTGDVPLSLTVETGASRNDLDLSDLRVTDLGVRTGASETVIRLPRAAGMTRAKVDAGAASIRVHVPDGVALRLQGRMQVGTNDVDTRRFPPSTTGWSSPDFDSAANRVELVVSGGLATLQVL